MRFALALVTIFWVTVVGAVEPRSLSLDQWVGWQTANSWTLLLANISAPGTAPGVVLASPSRRDPDYYFHWIRDAGLVMEIVVDRYESTRDPREKALCRKMLLDYVKLSRRNQGTDNPSGPAFGRGLGEPKFHADGSAFLGGWGRPQNDGPAIRANTLLRFAFALLREGDRALVRELYDGKLPTASVIKADLEFVAAEWREPSFDLWEEINGQHFYTRMVQRRSLILGARLARELGDVGAADWYLRQVAPLEIEIRKHWNPARGYVLATLDRVGGIDNKHSQLDVAVVLGALHGGMNDGFFDTSSVEVHATAEKLRARFGALYAVNKNERDFAGEPMNPGIGRYPEDHYDGLTTTGFGNPWFLATNALAELAYKAARGNAKVAKINKASLIANGDAYLRRTRAHTSLDGSTAEQFNRDNGFMQGARDLTWSYASFLTMSAARAATR